jgi:hypothetical protein
MATARNASNGNGFIAWADAPAEVHALPGARNGGEWGPRDLSLPAFFERLTDAERRAASAESRGTALEVEVERLHSRLKAAEAELGGARRSLELAEQSRHAAETRLADAREAIWRWLALLARTPFWRLRRRLAEPPAELRNQRLLSDGGG